MRCIKCLSSIIHESTRFFSTLPHVARSSSNVVQKLPTKEISNMQTSIARIPLSVSLAHFAHQDIKPATRKQRVRKMSQIAMQYLVETPRSNLHDNINQCLTSMHKQFEKGCYFSASDWAVRAVRYAVGRDHPDYAKVVKLSIK